MGEISFSLRKALQKRFPDKLYCVAITYDELAKSFYPEYVARSSDFMKIWKCYEESRDITELHFMARTIKG